MKNNEFELDELIKQAIEEEYSNVPAPPKGKEQTWNEISAKIPREKTQSSRKSVFPLVSAVFALLIVGTTIFNTSSLTAFEWMKEFFVYQDGSTAKFQSGSRPPDNSEMGPPSSKEFVVLDGKSETKTVSHSEAKDLADFSIRIPTYLPEGYSEKEARVNCFNDTCESVTLIYKNSDEKLLKIDQQYFQGAYGSGSTISNVVETKEVKVNGTKAVLIITSHENLKFLKWSTYSMEVSMDGYLTEEEMIKVAESLE